MFASTRPDIGYDIAEIAKYSVAECADVELSTLMLYNRTARFVKDYIRKIPYSSHGHRNGTFAHRWRRRQMMRLVVVAHSGFGSLTGSQSIECSATVLGEVVSRGGFITFQGALLDHRCAKIQRICKSSLAAERHAALTDADQALRMQSLLGEIVTGAYEIRHISPLSEFPFPDPLGPSPTEDKVKWQRKENKSKRHIFPRLALRVELKCLRLLQY